MNQMLFLRLGFTNTFTIQVLVRAPFFPYHNHCISEILERTMKFKPQGFLIGIRIIKMNQKLNQRQNNQNAFANDFSDGNYHFQPVPKSKFIFKYPGKNDKSSLFIIIFQKNVGSLFSGAPESSILFVHLQVWPAVQKQH